VLFRSYNRSRGIYRDSRTSYQNLGINFARYEKSNDDNYTWNSILNIDKTFNDAHSFNLTGVIEAINNVSDAVGASAQDIPAKYMGYHFLQTGIIKDRKSTRLNSSHVKISYAVFCLTKKK